MSDLSAPIGAGTERSGIRSIARAAEVLRLLSGPRRRLGVAELAREMSLPKGTVHGILRTLQLHGLAAKDEESGKYQLGAALVPMGFGHLDANRLRAAALVPAHALALRSGESVRVAMLCERRVLVIHHLLGRDARFHTLDVGRVVPAHASSLGRALLTQRPALLDELITDGFERLTPATVTDPTRLRRLIDDASRRGWVSVAGELSYGAGSIAAPIPTDGLASPGAIAIDGSIERLFVRGAAREELVGAVIDGARAVARALGVTTTRVPPVLDEPDGQPIWSVSSRDEARVTPGPGHTTGADDGFYLSSRDRSA